VALLRAHIADAAVAVLDVTQTRYFEADAIYTGSIVMQRGSGNVSNKSRKSL
jgi:hypothetical protein